MRVFAGGSTSRSNSRINRAKAIRLSLSMAAAGVDAFRPPGLR